jgi:hypothetical protein
MVESLLIVPVMVGKLAMAICTLSVPPLCKEEVQLYTGFDGSSEKSISQILKLVACRMMYAVWYWIIPVRDSIEKQIRPQSLYQ